MKKQKLKLKKFYNLNKKIIISAMIVLVFIIIISIFVFVIFSIFQEPKINTRKPINKCGDGVCDIKEKNDPNICPEDCQKSDSKNIFDLKYSSVNSEATKLDLYFPEKNCVGKLPLIIVIHGGAFKSGDKYPVDVSFLTDSCYAVASLNYRLSNEAIFPAGNIDVKSAVRWLRANADKYNLDSDNFGSMGRSAGGYYSSFLGTTRDIEDFEVGDNLEYSSEIQAVVSQYGIADFSTLTQDRKDAGAPKSIVESKYLGCDISLKDCKNATKASPINYISQKDPPFLILHGEKDSQIPIKQSENFEKALKKKNVSVKFITVPNAGHGGREFINYKSQILSFFNKHLKESEEGISSQKKQADIPYYVVVQHYDPVKQGGNATGRYDMAKNQIKYATEKNIKLSIWLGAGLVKYILENDKRVEDVKDWVEFGHEIGVHHHSIYKQNQTWDGYTALFEDEAVEIREAYLNGKIPEKYLGTQEDYMDIFHDLEDALTKKGISVQVKSGVNNEQFNKSTSMPDEIIYSTGSGFINNGDSGRFLVDDSNITKAVNEFVTTGYVNGIERKWLSHYPIGPSNNEIIAEDKFKELNNKSVFVGVCHNYEHEQEAYYRFIDFLHEQDSSGQNSRTITEVIESKILPEKEVNMLCENNNGTICGGIPSLPGECDGEWLNVPDYPFNAFGEYNCCLGNCIHEKLDNKQQCDLNNDGKIELKELNICQNNNIK
jgi:acetyl esterase/lipase